MTPWRLQEITQKTIRENRYQTAILPVGSTEAHGMHVPYGSDTMHSTIVAEKICERAWQQGARPILLPTIPYGVQGNTQHFPLTINVRQQHIDAIIVDIIRSLEFHGIEKLIIINGHGGNDFKPLLRDMYPQTKLFLALVDWWKVGSDKAKEIFEKSGEHADEMETSVDMALFGHLVHLGDANDGSVNRSRFEAIEKGWVSIARPWHLVTKDSTHGDPRKATKEKGERYVELVVERLTKFVLEVSNAKMDEHFPY
ncbi:MAG: creatininase family protein [Bacteroidota bacterium]